jgi:hypothetical protein
MNSAKQFESRALATRGRSGSGVIDYISCDSLSSWKILNKLGIWRRTVGLPEHTCPLRLQALNPHYMSNLLDMMSWFLLSPFRLAAVVLGASVLILIYRAVVYLSSPLFSPIRKLHGPPSPSYLLGHMESLLNGNSYKTLKSYNEQYGNVYAIKSMFGVS